MSRSLNEIRREFEDDFLDCDKNDLRNLGINVDEEMKAYDEAISNSGVEAIQNERENDYGDAKVSHTSIANFWNEYLSRKQDNEPSWELDATDVAVMLSLMKVSRLAYKRKHDSVLDFASYANFALQFEESEDANQ